jgi:hypothetical protein
VRVVAIHAADLSFPHRVMRGPHRIGSLVGMACEAGLDIPLRLQLGVRRLIGVNTVTVDAADSSRLVAASLPEEMSSTIVALLASLGLLGRSQPRDSRLVLNNRRVLDMLASRSVTCFTFMGREVGESLLAVLRLGQGFTLLLVAFEAGRLAHVLPFLCVGKRVGQKKEPKCYCDDHKTRTR